METRPQDDLNFGIFSGNLTRKPSTRRTPRGTLICEFSIANNKYVSEANGQWRKETSFFDIEVWDADAERCATLPVGSSVIVQFRARLDSWNANAGTANEEKRHRIKFRAENVHILRIGSTGPELPRPQ